MNFNHQEEYCLGFALSPGIGPMKYQSLLKHFVTPEKAFKAPGKDLSEILGSSTTIQFLHFRDTFDPNKLISRFGENNITVISQYSPLFPKLLMQISDPPICLFALHKDNRPNTNTGHTHIAVVGSRQNSGYGKTITYQITYELAEAGITIVSGLALGIDAIAHQAALDAKGGTIAVLGCGVDIVYPPQNRLLRQQIINSGNTIVSEFPPGSQPTRGSFVTRNRLVSGMCSGVLITEGTNKSGSLITATNAAHQGRDVFALPGPITSATAQAPLILLKQGAKLVTSSDDILAEYSINKHAHMRKARLTITPEQEQICTILSTESQFADEIAIRLNWSIIRVMSELSILEIQGIVEKDIDGRYIQSLA